MSQRNRIGRGLGRKHQADERDRRFPVRALLPREIELPRSKYWWSGGAWYDQGLSSTCVGHAWAHYAEDSPITHPGEVVDPYGIYREATRLDPWPENDGDLDFGTTVRAGAQAIQNRGYVIEYRWAENLDDIIQTIALLGPMVLGVDWFDSMFEPVRRNDSAGISRWFLDVDRSSGLAGGHAFKVDGVHIPGKAFRMKNSWGRSWGADGFASISFADMEMLVFRREGEACIAREVRVDSS